MTCPQCEQRRFGELGPCDGCGSIAVPFLGGYFNAHDPEPWHTVPWDPSAGGDEIKGKIVRAVRLAAAMALSQGHTAESLQRLPHYNQVTLPAALVRTAVRWGLVPSSSN